MEYTSPPHPAYYGFTSATPSPSGGHHHSFYYPGASPGHARHTSADYGFSSPPRGFPSPRYNSTGYYSTRAGYGSPLGGEAEFVSAKPKRQKSSGHRDHHRDHHRDFFWEQWVPPPKPTRRFSESYRASHGESDDDEFTIIDGYLCIVPGRRHRRERDREDYYERYRAQRTNDRYRQGQAHDRYDAPHMSSQSPRTPRTARHDRDDDRDRHHHRPRRQATSTPTPQRPSTSDRPRTSSRKTPPSPPKATEADAKRHHIPKGFSLKNWDPTEEPILLLGSVFDANSLGKWIYDWTVYHHGPATPISDMAGELWLLLIQLAGKVKRAEECMPRIRKEEDRDLVDDFILSGERLMDKLKKLLKACESPMLKAGSKKHKGEGREQLGKSAGIEFVESVFGRDRQLEQTEKFMASMRLWNLRFDANVEEILRWPSA